MSPNGRSSNNLSKSRLSGDLTLTASFVHAMIDLIQVDIGIGHYNARERR